MQIRQRHVTAGVAAVVTGLKQWRLFRYYSELKYHAGTAEACYGWSCCSRHKFLSVAHRRRIKTEEKAKFVAAA